MESAFRTTEGVKLIETLGWDGMRYARLDLHLSRLAASAQRLGFVCEGAQAALQDAAPDRPARVRLTLDAAGVLEVTTAALPPGKPIWRIALSPNRLVASDPWLSVKSTNRTHYDNARAALEPGVDEVIFANQAGELCEGSITNLFFDLGTGLATPPCHCGLLPGVLRAELLANGQCKEQVLSVSDAPKARLWVGNSLRGLIPATLLA
jgi:4-amino-4-deoxychorismate lyase